MWIIFMMMVQKYGTRKMYLEFGLMCSVIMFNLYSEIIMSNVLILYLPIWTSAVKFFPCLHCMYVSARYLLLCLVCGVVAFIRGLRVIRQRNQEECNSQPLMATFRETKD